MANKQNSAEACLKDRLELTVRGTLVAKINSAISCHF